MKLAVGFDQALYRPMLDVKHALEARTFPVSEASRPTVKFSCQRKRCNFRQLRECLRAEWITARARDRPRFTLQKSRNDVARPTPPRITGREGEDQSRQ